MTQNIPELQDAAYIKIVAMITENPTKYCDNNVCLVEHLVTESGMPMAQIFNAVLRLEQEKFIIARNIKSDDYWLGSLAPDSIKQDPNPPTSWLMDQASKRPSGRWP